MQMFRKVFSGKSIVFKASLVYVIVGFLNKAIGIITIPVFTRILSTSEMGVSTTYISWQTMLYPITSLSLVSGSLFIAMNEYKDKRNQYESSILSLSTLATLVFFIIYVCFHNFLNNLFTLPTEVMIFMFVCMLFQPALDMWMIRQRYEYNIRKMSYVTLASNISSALVAVMAVILLRNKGVNLGVIRIIFTYGTIAIFSLYFYLLIYREGKTFFNKTYWSYAIKLSVPLMVHTLAKNILDVSDRTMISSLCGKSEAGIYGTIYSVASLALIVWTAINNAFVPYLFDKLDKNSNKDAADINRITIALLLIFAAASIGLTAIAPEIVHILMTNEYYDAVYLIPAITGGIYLTCVYNLFSNVILYYKKTSYIMYGTLVAAVSNVLMNYIFIKIFGYQAAAYTTLVACVILSFMQYFGVKKVRKDKLYNYKKIFFISTIIILICLSFDFLYKNTLLRYIVIAVLIMLLFIFRKRIISLLGEIKDAKNINA